MLMRGHAKTPQPQLRNATMRFFATIFHGIALSRLHDTVGDPNCSIERSSTFWQELDKRTVVDTDAMFYKCKKTRAHVSHYTVKPCRS